MVPHFSFLIPHSPFLIFYFSFLIPHSSFLIPHSSFLIPHSSFLIPHSSFLIPHFSFLISHSSFLIPHFSFLISHYYITALITPTNANTISTAPVILLRMLNPFSLNNLVLIKFTNIVSVNHQSVAPTNIDAIPTIV